MHKALTFLLVNVSLTISAAIQLYGSLIFGQAVLVYTFRNHLNSLRSKSSPFARDFRQGVCLAYSIVFVLSFLLVIKAHVFGVMNLAAHLNSVLFIGLASAYATLFVRGLGTSTKHTGL